MTLSGKFGQVIWKPEHTVTDISIVLYDADGTWFVVAICGPCDALPSLDSGDKYWKCKSCNSTFDKVESAIGFAMFLTEFQKGSMVAYTWMKYWSGHNKFTMEIDGVMVMGDKK